MRRLVWIVLGLMSLGAGGSHHHHHHTAPHGGIVQTVDGGHAELTFDERNGTITLYLLGRRVADARPISAEGLSVQVEPVEPVGFGETIELELWPVATDDDPPGRSSRFVGSDAELFGLERFRAVVQGATFSVDADAFRDLWLCPMRCEQDRTYESEGRCPVCGMNLKPRNSAHGDHDPKHGGILFMAPNGWHHLEGVVTSDGEFRVYLYNDFTLPITATPFAEGTSVRVGPTVLQLEASEDGDYLTARLPTDVRRPLDLRLRLKLTPGKPPVGFDFHFE